MSTITTVARSDLICDLLQITGEARMPRYLQWPFRVDGLGLDLKHATKRGATRTSRGRSTRCPTSWSAIGGT